MEGMRKIGLIAAAGCLISACGGPVVTMKNDQSGAVVSCKGGSFATGMTSDRVATDLLTECVDGYTRQGYTVIAATQ